MSTETLYIKKGNRYVVAGISSQIDLYPGIWMVQKTEGCTSAQSICISDLPAISSLVEVVQAKRIAEIIMEKLKPLWIANEMIIYNRSFYEVERMMSDAIVEHVNQGRAEAASSGHEEAIARGTNLANKTLEEVENPSNRNTWHQQNLSKIEILLNEILTIGYRKVGTAEFTSFMYELKRIIKANGIELQRSSLIGGMPINPSSDEE